MIDASEKSASANAPTPQMEMTRRTWLKWAATATAVAFASGGLAWLNRDRLKWLQTADVERRLRAHFDYLQLEISSDEMRRFATEYATHYGRTARGGLYRYIKRLPAAHYDEQWDDLATTFLLSTDFFLHAGNESLPVHYVTLFHPYASPCWNPISLAAAAADVNSAAT
jgi:hypothetical protein